MLRSQEIAPQRDGEGRDEVTWVNSNRIGFSRLFSTFALDFIHSGEASSTADRTG